MSRFQAVGAGLAGVSLAAALAAVGIGTVGSALTLALVPVNWAESIQMVLFSAPAAVAVLLGCISLFVGLLAAWRGGLGRWPGWVGVLGGSIGLLAAASGVAWLLFLGGIAFLAMFAWH